MEEKKDQNNDLDEQANKKKENEDKNKDISDEDLEFMISEVEQRLGIDRSQFRIIKHKQKRSLKDILIDIGLSLFFNIVLLMSITGFIEWARFQSPLDVFIYALLFSVLEIGFKYFSFYIFRKRLMRTMLLIMTLPTLLAIPLSLLINDAIGLANIILTKELHLVLLMFVVFIIARSIFKGFIIRRRRMIR